jgi:hypothetical protein
MCTIAPDCESKAAISTLLWINYVAKANQCESKPVSGVLFKAAFVLTLNSLRSAGSTSQRVPAARAARLRSS